MRKQIVWGMLVTGLLGATAQAITIATFADPAADETTPLFLYDADAGEVEASWSGTGLTLETTDTDISNVTFVMEAVMETSPGVFGAGQIDFFDLANSIDPIFTINFDSAALSVNGFGATEFLATNGIVFSGPILPAPVDEESFAFAFTNQVAVAPPGSFSATASFTSSVGIIIPEPATLSLLAAGGLLLTRRRR